MRLRRRPAGEPSLEPVLPGGLTLHTDVTPADWVVAEVRDFEYDVGSLVPTRFPAYARVFHPAGRTGPGGEEEVRWTAVAAANGRVAHPSMEWASITGSWGYQHGETQPGLWDRPPPEGSLPAPQGRQLAELLAPRTGAPDRCWFGVWDGWGGAVIRTDGVPTVALPARPTLLFSGPLSAAATSFTTRSWHHQSASVWWPDDRAWFVATEVDLMATYVGGSAACIAALVADDRLEALPVSVDERVTWDSDEVNGAPPRPDG